MLGLLQSQPIFSQHGIRVDQHRNKVQNPFIRTHMLNLGDIYGDT